MNRLNRSLLAAVVAGGLCGGVGFVQAGSFVSAQGVQRFDEGHWKHPHMHKAIEKLREARKELDLAEDVFSGHKAEAQDHIDKAVAEGEAGLKEQSDFAATPSQVPSARALDGHFPHMHAALDLLREARKELDACDPVFAGHRDEAIKQTDRAIKQLDDAIKAAEQ